MNEDGDDKYWWKLSYLTSKWSKNENPGGIPLNPGIKKIGKSRPEKFSILLGPAVGSPPPTEQSNK